MATMSEVLTDARDAVVSLGLVLSPTAINASNTPNSLADAVFSITMQTSNSGKFRERSPGHIRYDHALMVSVLGRIKPLDQFTSYAALVGTEEGVIKSLLTQFKMPQYRVEYTSTRRRILPSGEYLLLEISFSVEQSGDLT